MLDYINIPSTMYRKEKCFNQSKQQKYNLRVVLVGPQNTGKSALIGRFARSSFDPGYRMTLKTYETSKIVQISQDYSVKLQLIDTVGSGVDRSFQDVVKNCQAILFFYDITNEQSMLKLQTWLQQVRNSINKDCFFGLVGTHLDEPYKRQVSFNEGLRFKKSNQFQLFSQISSKTNENITELFDELIKQLLMKSIFRQQQQNPQISTLFSESRIASGQHISRIIVLEKKLAMKEAECATLWHDYQQLLQKYYSNGRIDNHNYLIETPRTDYQAQGERKMQRIIQQLQTRLSQLQNDYESEKQNVASVKKEMIVIQQTNSKLQNQKRQLQQKIRTLMQEIDIIEMAIDQREKQINTAFDAKNEELRLKEQSINQKDAEIFELSIRLTNQIQYFSTKYRQHQQIQSELRMLTQQKNDKIEELNKELKHACQKIQQSFNIIDQYEQKMTHYRHQIVQKGYLEKELQLQQQKCMRLQLNYEQIIRQLNFKINRMIEDHHSQNQQLISHKQSLVQKGISDKIKEISVIKGFLQQLQQQKQQQKQSIHLTTHAKLEMKNISEQDCDKSEKVKNHYVDSIIGNMKATSEYMLDQLQGVYIKYQQLKEKSLQLINLSQGIDLKEILKQTKKNKTYQQHSLVIRQEELKIVQLLQVQISEKMAKYVTQINDIVMQFEDNNSQLQSSLSLINAGIQRVTLITDLGIGKYIEQYYTD